MKVLVYGGSGFIGNRVLRKLIERGQDVAAFDINPNLPAYDADLQGQVPLFRGDITLMDDVVEAMLAYPITAVQRIRIPGRAGQAHP